MSVSPLISIIIPLYNSGMFITATIDSVLNQSYTNWELLLIDDASMDNTVAVAKTFQAKDSRINLYKNRTNKGTAYCRNRATELSKGTFIAFLDSDDLWHPGKLEKQLNFMQDHSCFVSYTSYQLINEVGKSLHKRVAALPQLTYRKQLKNNYIGNLTGMYNASVLGKISAPTLRKRQDWAVWLEAIKLSGKPALGIQEDLAYYRVRAGSISSNKVSLIKYNFNFYRKHLGYSFPKACYYFLVFFFEYFFIRPKYIIKA